MADAENENLKVFYRTMTTKQLLDYRRALGLDADDARRQGRKQSVQFAEHRLQLVADVLKERGVEALT